MKKEKENRRDSLEKGISMGKGIGGGILFFLFIDV